MVSIDGGDSALVSNLSLNWMRRVMFGDERLVFFFYRRDDETDYSGQ